MSFIRDFINYIISFCVRRKDQDINLEDNLLDDCEQHGYVCCGYMTDIDTSDYDSDNSELSVKSALYR